MNPSPALDNLREAVEKFSADKDSGGMVSQALVIYEIVGVDDDGDTFRKVDYAIPSDNFSLTGGLGMVEAARYYIRKAILGSDEEDD